MRGWKEQVESGATPAELIKASPEFPEMFASLYATGEISGQLDETLGRLHRHYQEEGNRKMRTIAQWSPKLVYYVVMLLVAWHIISFYYHLYGPGSDTDNAIKDLESRQIEQTARTNMTIDELHSNEELRRHEFPVARSKIFLAHSSASPLPRRVAGALRDYAPQCSPNASQDSPVPPAASSRRVNWRRI